MAQEERRVTTPDGHQVKLPENLIPEVELFITNTYKRVTSDFSKTEYGHAAMDLAVVAIANASNDATPEEQRAYFRAYALKKIEEYGKGILSFLRDELKLALTEEDLKNIGS